MPPPFMLIIMAVYRAKKKDTQPKKDAVTAHTPVSNESMERLARIMNDSPSIMKLHGTEWCIKGLKPGVQWLIAEQACRIVKGEKLSMGDVIKEFAVNLPAVAHVITLALLNDKDRIFSDYEKKELSDDYHKVYDLLMWGEYDIKDWALLLGEILNLISTDFFREYQCDSDREGDDTGEEDEENGTKLIISRTEWGQMIDFLRSNTWCSREEYLWGMTIGQVRLSSFDFSHVEYGNKDKKKKKVSKIGSVDDLKNLNDLGMPIINKKG